MSFLSFHIRVQRDQPFIKELGGHPCLLVCAVFGRERVYVLETPMFCRFSYEEKINGDRYRAMITNFFIPELNNHDVQELWFQQDGATCHTARATIDLLKDTFGDRLISRFGPELASKIL
ncbi:hypothetical protein TNCV_773451 [Trichonephila clavipes]|nr:hypothetical protein TNCV_773451 [Trichonephila clavipes]